MDKYAKKMTLLEKGVLVAGLLIIAVGYLLFFTNLPLFELYTKEDHLVERLTVFGLLMGSFVSLRRALRLGGSRGWMLFLTALLLGLIYLLRRR